MTSKIDDGGSDALKGLVDKTIQTITAQLSLDQPAGRVECASLTSRQLAQMIDHTLLKPDATYEELRMVCREARDNGFATVCVNSAHIALVTNELKDSAVKPIAVVGFPLGAMLTSAKVFETKEAIRLGAQEIDMVINLGALKSHDYVLVVDDIVQVVEAAYPFVVKVILETANLNQDEKIAAAFLAKTAGAGFVKSSTGFGKGGATVEDIALLRLVVGSDIKVKASGGIRSLDDTLKMIEAGADRIGASASVAIVKGEHLASGGY